MPLAELVATNVRCLERAELELHPRLNLIAGPNGSGKTSVLEAIYLLGRGHSFRTRSSEKLVRRGQPSLTVFGRTGGDVPHAIGVEVAAGSGGSGPTTRAKVDGEFLKSLAGLATVFPVQAIGPTVHELVDGGPGYRRRWLDWAVFHVEPGFADAWFRYTRALKQRNAALRSGAGDPSLWEREMATAGETLTVARRAVLDRLLPYWQACYAELLGEEVGLQLSFHSGWEADRSLQEVLASHREADVSRGTTTSGPHRADVRLRISARAARDVLSRGQQKLAAVALILAQLDMLKAGPGLQPTLLVDDPAAELDRERLSALIARILRLGNPLVVTALDPDSQLFGTPDRLFSAGQGGVRRL